MIRLFDTPPFALRSKGGRTLRDLKTPLVRAALWLLLALPGGLIAADTQAAPVRGQHAGKQENGISASQAAAIARGSYGGKVLNVQRKGSVYYVKLLLPSSHVKMVAVSAETGAIVGRETEV